MAKSKVVPHVFREEIDRLTLVHGTPSIPITVNGRLSRSIARTKWKVGFATVEVDVNPDLAYMDERAIIETARHEFAHVLEWYHHRTSGHGARWKLYARLTGAVPRATSTEQERIQATIEGSQ